MPDGGYQKGLLNTLGLGTGRKSDAQLLLSKNKIVALRHAFNYVIEDEFDIKQLPNDYKGIQCRLDRVCNSAFTFAKCWKVITWIIRRMRVEGTIPKSKHLDIKISLDGRPFASKSQVLVGIICLDDKDNVQSNKYVYPICVVDGQESLDLFNVILADISTARQDLEHNGIVVDDIQYSILFFGKLSLLLLQLIVV